MISRRNIRVKVMQALYAADAMSNSAGDETKVGLRLLDAKLNRTMDVFTTMVAYMVDIARYAKTDAANRSQKYLPSADDLNASTRLAENDWVLRMESNSSFQKKYEELHKREAVSPEWVKKLFQEFSKTEAYQQYISAGFSKASDELAVMKSLWAFLQNHERFNDYRTDEVNGWEEDYQQVDMLMENLLMQQQRVNFSIPLSKDKQEYATSLLETVVEKEEQCMELIKPKLQNWDPERVAQIDLILLKMAVSELLFFPTIPTKVTINEYIEIAKQYSTPQSGQFINGVIDNIQKELHQTGVINKQERYNKK